MKTPLRRNKTLGGHQRYNYYSSQGTIEVSDATYRDPSQGNKRVQIQSPASPPVPSTGISANVANNFSVEGEEMGDPEEDWETEPSDECSKPRANLKRNINSTRFVRRPSQPSQNGAFEAIPGAEKEIFFQE